MEDELRRVKKEFEDYKESKNREFEEYKRMYTEVVDALKRENEQWKPERQVFLAERHLMQRQNEIRYKTANRRMRKIEKEYHEEMNELLKEFREKMNETLKKKLKKMQEIETVDLEEDEEDTGGVWKMLTHSFQYFFGVSKRGGKRAVKRTMEHADEEEPETKRKCTDGRKTPGLISVKRELAEMAIEDDQ
ncbi:unnamed protein product [Caenorhabditis nigoni]